MLRLDIRLKNDRRLRLLNAYSPTAAKPAEAEVFLEQLSAQLDSLPQRSDTLVVLGDFNAVARKGDRAKFAQPPENKNSRAFDDFLRRYDLLSLNCQFKKPRNRLITFTGRKRPRRNARGKLATTRLAQLDHILLRAREKNRAADCDTFRVLSMRSDHKLLYCILKLHDSLYRPTNAPPRRLTIALRDPKFRAKFSSSFAKNIGQDRTPNYATVSSAIRQTAADTLPLAKRTQCDTSVWMESPAVKETQQQVIALRIKGEKAEEEEQALAKTIKAKQAEAVDDAIRRMSEAGHDQKARIVWSVINNLTGRKQKQHLNLSADTAAERKEEIRRFFASTVNAPPPPAMTEMPLPPGTELPCTEHFDVRGVTADDVMRFAKASPGNKATGPDEVPIESLRIPRIAMEVARIMNCVMDGSEAPREWRTAYIVGIPKKAGASRVEDLRGISLMSTAAKLFNRILLSRLQPVLEPYLRYEQNGFRPERGTVAQILALRRILEEGRLRQSDTVCVFVDFRKAFDSVSRPALPKIMQAYNIPDKLIAAVMALYKDTTAAVITPDGLTAPFATTSGVLQGDTLAPFLFILTLDWALRTGLPSDSEDGLLLQRRLSRRHPERRLALLGYADDLALLANTFASAQRLLDGLLAAAQTVGLEINARKTEVLTIPLDLPGSISVTDRDGTQSTLTRCCSFTYLGGIVPDTQADLDKRRALAWGAFRSMRKILLCSSLPDSSRGQLFKATIETVLLYNTETLTLTESLSKQLDATHASLMRAALGLHRSTADSHVSTRSLCERLGTTAASEIVRSRRLALVGHLLRAEQHCPQALHDTLLLSLPGAQRVGQARMKRYCDIIAEDAGAPEGEGLKQHLTERAVRRSL
jgi:sorting nexin-29